MLGGDDTVSDNCMTENGEYGFHNNIDSPGIWMNTDNAGFLVQDNYISDNGGEGLMYEISYNAKIIDDTFVGNAIPNGEGNEGFSTGGIYISESGGNSTVPSTYAGQLNIEGHVLEDNWAGVVLYQNANRYADDGEDAGTLTPPPGVNITDWINSPGQCGNAGDLAETSPVDYSSYCQWRTQDVTVQGNVFQFDPSDAIFGDQCTEANACGQNALFSVYSSSAAYPAWSVCSDISNKQHNVFEDNTDQGPWTFVYFGQGDSESCAQWRAGATNVQGSGDNFPPQDAGSTYSG